MKSSSPIDPPALGRGVWGWLGGAGVIPETPISTSRGKHGLGEEIQQRDPEVHGDTQRTASCFCHTQRDPAYGGSILS